MKIELLQIVEERPVNMEMLEYLGQAFNWLNQKLRLQPLTIDVMLQTVTLFQDDKKENFDKYKVP